MYFLIDYENVNYAGLEGTEFLERNDTISFFFGVESSKIINYRMMDIERSECSVEICKLRNARKNALDYYIASKVGEIFAVNRNAQVAIISADKDHQAVIDYWKPRLPVQNQLVRAKTIASAIKLVYGEGARKMIVNDRMKTLDLESEYARYEERRKLVSVLEGVLSDTEYEHLIPQIADMLRVAQGPKILYLNSLKTFGKKAGTEVYRQIKGCVAGI